MAVFTGNGNTSRYFKVPYNSLLGFPGSDWFLYFWMQCDDNAGSAFQYIYSFGPPADANSVNIYMGEDSQAQAGKWFFNMEGDGDSAGQATTDSSGGDSVPRLFVAQRNGSNFEVYIAEAHQTPVLDIQRSFTFDALSANSYDLYISARTDLNSARYFGGHVGDMVKGSGALTSEQIAAIAKGALPIHVIDPATIDFWFPFRENQSQVVDLINGLVATRNGTGLSTTEHFPIIGNDFRYLTSAVSGGTTLVIQDATHSHFADALVLSQNHVLAINDAQHSHQADNLLLSQVHQLAIQEATHSHTADNLDLDQEQVLTIQSAEHGHTADNLTISFELSLTIQEATHSHTADNLALTQDHTLVIAEATHSHQADNLVLSTNIELAIQATEHGHFADNLDLTQNYTLVIQAAEHGHFADNLDLSQNYILVIQDAQHGHTVDNVEISGYLTIQESTHSHFADNLTLSQVNVLEIQNCFHALLGDNVTLVYGTNEWTEQPQDAGIWTVQGVNSGTWSEQAKNSNPWTEV